jgi:hypothetical protein
MKLPAGFKSNPNLDSFLGNALLYLIEGWKFYVTSEITPLESLIVYYIAILGTLGASF